jgi:hypothetical protein
MKPRGHISCFHECKKVWGNETFALPSELPLWELESMWILESLEGDCRGPNSLDWRVTYIIWNILEHSCLKWDCMTHLGTWNISYGQKKVRKSNCQFDSQPLKVMNHRDFLTCRWRATYHWKAFNEGYNFAKTSPQSKVCTQSYGPPKLWESQF